MPPPPRPVLPPAGDARRRVAGAALSAVALTAFAAPAASARAQPPEPPLERTVPGTRWIVVVAEGAGEARSIGSYSVRVYAEPELGGRYDRFVAGTIRPRDGALESLLLVDLDRDGTQEIVVTTRSVGTGGYLSADAFRLRDGVPRWAASVASLPRDEDPLPALTASLRARTP